MRKLIPSFILMILTATNFASAQNTSITSELEPITSSNINRLELIDHFGDPRPADLIWSPDGYTLGVGTETDIRLYDTHDLNQEPVFIDTYGSRYRYDATGQFITDSWQLWDTTSGEQLTAKGFSEISPSGRWGLSIESGESIKTTITVWNTHNLDEPIFELQTGLEIEPIYFGVRFSPDETTLALMLSNEWQVQFNPTGTIVVQLWSLETGTLLNTTNLENGGWLMFSADSEWLITNGAVYDFFYSTLYKGDIEIWETHTGRLVERWEDAHQVMAISPNRQWFVFIQNGDIKLWRNGEGLQSLSGLDEGATNFVFSPNNQYLAGINSYNQSVLWDLRQPQPTITLNTGDIQVTDFTFSPNSQLVVGRTIENYFVLWDTNTGNVLSDLGHLENGIDAVFSPDGTYLALGSTVSFEGMLSIWNIQDTDNIAAIYQFEPEQSIQLNNDWTLGAYWDEPAGSVHLLDIETGDESLISILPHYLGGILVFDTSHEQGIFTRDATQVGKNQTFDMVDLTTGQRRFSFTTPDINTWRMSPTGQQIAVTYYPADIGQDSPLYIYDLTQQPVQATYIPTDAETWTVTYSPDGSLIALSNRDTGMVELWHTDSAQLAATWYAGEWLSSVNQFTPNGKWLITTSYISGVSVWNVEVLLATARSNRTREIDARPQVRFDLSAFGSGSGLIFSPMSDKIAVQVGSNENSGLAVIDLATALNTNEEVIRLTSGDVTFAPHAQIGPSYFSPDGQLLFANIQSENGIFVLDAKTGKQLRHFQDANTYLSGPQSAFSPDGSLFVLNLGSEIRWWDMATLESGQGEPFFTQTLDSRWWGVIGFNAEGTRIFVSESDGISVWGVRSE